MFSEPQDCVSLSIHVLHGLSRMCWLTVIHCSCTLCTLTYKKYILICIDVNVNIGNVLILFSDLEWSVSCLDLVF